MAGRWHYLTKELLKIYSNIFVEAEYLLNFVAASVIAIIECKFFGYEAHRRG